MSSSASDPEPKSPGATTPDAAASEFLSEASEEYRALRRVQPPAAPVRPDVRERPAAVVVPGPRPLSPSPPSVSPPSSPASPARAVVRPPAATPLVVSLPAVRRPVVGPPTSPAPPSVATSSAALPLVATAPAALPSTGKAPASERRRSVPWGWLVGVVALAVAATAWPLVRGMRTSENLSAPEAAATRGSVTIASRPAGAQVWVGGAMRGVTPLELQLPAGTQEVELRNGGAVRVLSLVVTPGTSVRESVDLPATLATGWIEISTDAPGAQVTVDGVARGVTPVVVGGLAPGEHAVRLRAGGAVVDRSVKVVAGGTATVVASVVPAGAAGGFLTVRAPFELQVWQRGQVVGTTSADRVMLPAGSLDLELVADAYEFRTTIAPVIRAGQTTAVEVAVPSGSLSLNAVPWADVWLDGVALGATPLANLNVPVGPHQVIWRHPSLGERTQTVRVGVTTPSRASVSFAEGR